MAEEKDLLNLFYHEDGSRRTVEDSGRDPLTGLVRMHPFMGRMQKMRVEKSEAEGEDELVVLFLDLINFRMINLREGIARGDQCLKILGNCLTECFPEGIVSHFDADHFALITTRRNLEDRIATAREEFRKSFHIPLDCAIGACVWDHHEDNAETLLNYAKAACDEARKKIGSYVCFYTPEIGEDMETTEYVISHIDEAVNKGWIQVYYQPLVRSITNKICGLEALARWKDPERGMLPPIDFIGPLEKSHQIWKLDRSVISQVIQQIAERSGRGEPEIPVSINLSRIDFIVCDIFQEIEKLVQAYDVPRRMLHIEVTESIMMSGNSNIPETLDAFRNAGYEIWMDDFGSGYSTLNLLKDYSFDVLKLDMIFLRSDSPRSRDIITSVVEMDKRIGIRTLAEGVETAEQAEFLKKIGCEKMQGYYFGKPMPYDEMLEHSIKRGLGIETARQKTCYDALGTVNFMTDIPLVIVEEKGGNFHLPYMNEAGLKLLHRDGVSGLSELEKTANDHENDAGALIYQAGQYAVHSGHTGEMFTSFKGKERLIKYQFLGKYDDTSLFSALIYEQTPAGEDLSDKRRMLQNVLYFYTYIFGIDFRKMTIQDIRYTEGFAIQSHAMPLKNKSGYASLLPSIFPVDQKRFDAFLDPKTLKTRLEDSEDGTIREDFRTKDSQGRFVWMTHQIHFMPNSEERQGLYVIQKAEKGKETSRTLALRGESARKEDQVRSGLWQELMLHIPLPIFWKDINRRFLGASQYFLDYYGFRSVDDILGRTDEDMGWHPNNENYLSDEEEILRTGAVHFNVPGKCIVNGESRRIYATKWPTYRDGKITGLMGYFLDPEIRLNPENKEKKHFPDASDRMENVAKFLEDLVAYEADYRLNRRNFGALYVRIPEIQRISDNYGHPIMYSVVETCAKAIGKAVGHAASVSYVGVGEFAIVSAYVSEDELQDKAEQIRQGINAIRTVDGVSCTLYAKVFCFYAEEVSGLRDWLSHMVTIFVKSREDLNLKKTGQKFSGCGAGIKPPVRLAFDLEGSNRTIRTLMDSAGIGCYILKPDHTILYWNRTAEELLGFEASEMQGRKCTEMPLGCSFTSSTAIPDYSCPATVAYATGKTSSLQMFMKNKNGKDVLIRNTLVPLKDLDGKICELVSFFVPITDDSYDASMVRNIYEMATRDPVTGLPGRKYMESCLGEELERFRRDGKPFAVLFADINDFHEVNNRYGHEAGDAILGVMGMALQKFGRKADHFCRWGGDEFVGLLHLRDSSDLSGAAKRLHEVAGSCDAEVNGRKISCQTAIGITVVRKEDDVKSLIARADSYMYESKRHSDKRVITDLNVGDVV
ncbi:MAG: EAL domain-containing protein [Lachnospiraceae bacterium]|nr:EAL domain-containing protein [Lachnospiraceae bacterium]